MTAVRGMVLVVVMGLVGCSGLTNEQIIAADALCKSAGMDTKLNYLLVSSTRPTDAVCVPRNPTIQEARHDER